MDFKTGTWEKLEKKYIKGKTTREDVVKQAGAEMFAVIRLYCEEIINNNENKSADKYNDAREMVEMFQDKNPHSQFVALLGIDMLKISTSISEETIKAKRKTVFPTASMIADCVNATLKNKNPEDMITTDEYVEIMSDIEVQKAGLKRVKESIKDKIFPMFTKEEMKTAMDLVMKYREMARETAGTDDRESLIYVYLSDDFFNLVLNENGFLRDLDGNLLEHDYMAGIKALRLDRFPSGTEYLSSRGYKFKCLSYYRDLLKKLKENGHVDGVTITEDELAKKINDLEKELAAPHEHDGPTIVIDRKKRNTEGSNIRVLKADKDS